MLLNTKKKLSAQLGTTKVHSKINESKFSKGYIDFLSEAGWKLEKKLPSNYNNYSDLLEDTDWKSNNINYRCSKHYRRDLDALS